MRGSRSSHTLAADQIRVGLAPAGHCESREAEHLRVSIQSPATTNRQGRVGGWHILGSQSIRLRLYDTASISRLRPSIHCSAIPSFSLATLSCKYAISLPYGPGAPEGDTIELDSGIELGCVYPAVFGGPSRSRGTASLPRPLGGAESGGGS